MTSKSHNTYNICNCGFANKTSYKMCRNVHDLSSLQISHAKIQWLIRYSSETESWEEISRGQYAVILRSTSILPSQKLHIISKNLLSYTISGYGGTLAWYRCHFTTWRIRHIFISERRNLNTTAYWVIVEFRENWCGERYILLKCVNKSSQSAWHNCMKIGQMSDFHTIMSLRGQWTCQMTVWDSVSQLGCRETLGSSRTPTWVPRGIVK